MFALYGTALVLLDPRRKDRYQCLDLKDHGGRSTVIMLSSGECRRDEANGWRRMLDGRLAHRKSGRCLGYNQTSKELRGDNCFGEGKWRGWPDVVHTGGRHEQGKAFVRAIRIDAASSSHKGPRMS